MKYLKLALLLLTYQSTFAQLPIKSLYGTWVVSSVGFKDGSELPKDNLLKFAYFKYTFMEPDKVAFTTAYYETGTENNFELDKNILLIKNQQGYVMNSFKINIAGDTLSLLQKGANGFEDPNCLNYKLISENNYQKGLPLTPNDIYAIRNGDTIYKESRKIYAKYIGPSFQQYIYAGISGKMDGKSGHFTARFTVSKEGVADSLKIINGISKKFDTRFLKVFTQAKNNWLPGYINNKPVPVRMMVELRYSTSEEVIPAHFAGQQANDAYNNKDYETAIFFYDQALETDPDDKDHLFRRGMSKMLLGNFKGACEDWNNVQKLGGNTNAEDAIKRYCK
ncbi:hypothetical protein [Mucilaginibacter sp.]|uniref:hypothetical protein n=1 Tax=Mucilaginibacter sp. TaxID=1882438 RepID=UPI0032657129